jgi:RNA-binding protein NOB1
MAHEKSVHCIVLDASPLLLNQPSISSLLATAEDLYTVPAVIAEIRDPQARNRLETTVLPFLKVRSPSPVSIQTVSEFARKTGDFAVLSGPDLQVLALAYELECERNQGDWRLRKTPGQKGLNGLPPNTREPATGTDAATGDSMDSHHRSTAETEQSGAHEAENEEPRTTEAQTDTSLSEASPENATSGTENSETTEKSAMSTSEIAVTTERMTTLQIDDGGAQEPTVADVTSEGSESDHVANAEDTESGSDDEGWITPSNLKRHQRMDNDTASNPSKTPSRLQVATMTTDYALQNTLLLMNLNLLSSSLHRISHLKSHILRCHACFATTKQMDRQFCARCGKPTLTRVTCTTSANGEFKLHLKANMQWNHRGDRYSIPKPAAGSSSGKRAKGGRGQGGKGGWGNDLIFSNDQKEYTRAMASQKRQQTRDLMDEDYLPNILSGARSSTSRIKIGPGRDVNSRKR